MGVRQLQRTTSGTVRHLAQCAASAAAAPWSPPGAAGEAPSLPRPATAAGPSPGEGAGPSPPLPGGPALPWLPARPSEAAPSVAPAAVPAAVHVPPAARFPAAPADMGLFAGTGSSADTG